SRMLYFLYGGATLSDDIYERLQALSVAASGMRTPVLTTYGATETQGITMTHWAIERVGMIGLPLPGTTIKLAPVGGKLEVRVKGGCVMSGYLDMPEVTREAFDDEGYYRLGDAARFEDPQRPEKGLVFDGRVAEDFKLSSGTWVSVGTLRPALVAACAPFVQDAVICGQDKPYVAALLWPSQAALYNVSLQHNGDRAAAFEDLERRIAYCVTAFNARQNGSSSKIMRFELLDTPPSLDDGEITDKGYVNQRQAQLVRAQAVGKLFPKRK
ncbi:MAG: acyl-CoA synthetase, partial [Alphaproteobacteria bacterium]